MEVNVYLYMCVYIYITSTDPIPDTREPLGVGGRLGIDEKPGLLAPVAEGAEGVVVVEAAAAVPITLPPPIPLHGSRSSLSGTNRICEPLLIGIAADWRRRRWDLGRIR